ncbi:MAG: type II secretion system minor pseudopilin GspI [Marinobacterium sp.]|nr:type II secretion system minor pseudopilin GspI [Marinobacterium sp.]
MNRHDHHSQRGMTLLEVLVAISVLMLVGFSALQFQNYSAGPLLSLQQQQRALMVAQNQLVLARLTDYRTLRNNNGTEYQGGMALRWQRDVEAVDGFAMKRVIVRVSEDARDRPRQLAELTAYIASQTGTTSQNDSAGSEQ